MTDQPNTNPAPKGKFGKWKSFLLLLTLSYASVISLSSAAMAEEGNIPPALEKQLYCGDWIEDKASKMNPVLDGVKKIVIVMDFFEAGFSDDSEKRFNSIFHMRNFGERLKASFVEMLRPIPPKEEDRLKSSIAECYRRDNRPVEIVYKTSVEGHVQLPYEQYMEEPGVLIVLVKRYGHFWALGKERSKKRWGALENVTDTFALTAILYRTDMQLDPRRALLTPFSVNSSSEEAPNAALISEYMINRITWDVF